MIHPSCDDAEHSVDHMSLESPLKMCFMMDVGVKSESRLTSADKTWNCMKLGQPLTNVKLFFQFFI